MGSSLCMRLYIILMQKSGIRLKIDYKKVYVNCDSLLCCHNKKGSMINGAPGLNKS
jgi:hypothetical protein